MKTSWQCQALQSGQGISIFLFFLKKASSFVLRKKKNIFEALGLIASCKVQSASLTMLRGASNLLLTVSL